MIKNFHFKILMGLSIFAFVVSFIFLFAGLQSSTAGAGIAIGGLFSAFGLFASITAGAIRSINRRLDRAGIADDPQHPTCDGQTVNQKADHIVAPNPFEAPTLNSASYVRGSEDWKRSSKK